jgi:outer membrane protein assembly factor BamE (lipoprotein component of BamABCDE complex)
MQPWWRILIILLAWLAASACVSTGVREITEPERCARLEGGKSTKAEVAALLGYPTLVNYGQQGEEAWNYYYVTEYPRALDFFPLAGALEDGLQQTTRVLTVSFDRQGVFHHLQPSQSTSRAAVFPY